MKKNLSFLIILLNAVSIIILYSCDKPQLSPTPPVNPPIDTTKPPSTDTTKHPIDTITHPGVDTSKPGFDIDSRWECDVDGVHYAGTIDTSIAFYRFNYSFPQDTTLFCTGSSDDKKATIHLQLSINRSLYNFGNTIKVGHILFDTCSLPVLLSGDDKVSYYIDSLKGNTLSAKFEGTVVTNGTYTEHAITNGKFTCWFNHGNNDPNSFYLQAANLSNTRMDTLRGFFNYARINANTLILDGTQSSWSARSRVRLSIRTGGTIKPGIYKSIDGDVGFEYFIPDIYPYSITSQYGEMTVNITSVTDNIVKGEFSGNNGNGKNIAAGTFAARVRDYVPESDSEDKWKFSFYDDGTTRYALYGGNVLNATKSTENGKYYLKIFGETDHGQSPFNIVISSPNAIKPGVYSGNTFDGDNLDLVDFRSDIKIWNGNTTHIYSNNDRDTYCRIDSITTQKVYGTLYGALYKEYSPNARSGAEIQKGSFQAAFH